jgi:hypothetical protein
VDPRLPLRARLLAVQARAEAARGHRRPAASLAEQALDLARRAQDRRALFDALLAKRVSLHVPQEAARALETASELMAIAEDLDRKPLLFAACEARIPALLALGKLQAADEDIGALAEIAALLRAPGYEYTAARFQLGRALGDGRIQGLGPLLERVRSLGWAAGDPSADWKHRAVKLWILYAEGRLATARARMEAAEDRGHVQGVAAHTAHADFWRSLGEARRCAGHFEQAAAQGFETLEIDGDWLWTLCTCAQVCAYLSDKRRARQLYELMAPHAPYNVVSSLHVYRGSAHYPLARLALVLGDRSLAWSHFESAIAFNRRIGARAALLFAEAHYGRALLGGTPDERTRGAALVEAVSREAESLGIARLRRAPDPRAEI